MGDSLISVIVPIYNGEKYLNRCIDSILNQSYKNIEVILINDGSKDDSASICKEYEKKDKRVRFFSKENSGVSNTRNLGIKESKGKYIMFADCDDCVTSNCIEVLLNNLNQYNTDISIGNVLKTDNPGESINNVDEQIKLFNEDKQLLYLTIYNNHFDDIKYTEGPCAKLIRSDLIKGNNIFFDSDLRYGEDSLFSLNCYFHANSVVLSNIFVYYYYVNEMSVSSGKVFALKNEIYKMISKHKEELVRLNLFESLEDDFDFFCFRQVEKIFRNARFSKNEFLSFIREDNIQQILKKIRYKKYSFKTNIKIFLYKHEFYELLKFLFIKWL